MKVLSKAVRVGYPTLQLGANPIKQFITEIHKSNPRHLENAIDI
jgi:hypothetical protein